MKKRQRPNPTADAPKKDPVLPPGFSSSKAKEMDNVTASLSAIYGKQPGTAPEDLTRLVHGKRRTWLLFVLGSAAFLSLLAIVAWIGFLWWNGRAYAAGLQIVVEGPSRIALGQETTYFINWFNRSKDPLAAAELRVTFPSDFMLSAMEPQPTQHGEGNTAFTYRLGSQPAEARGTVKVTGTFTGALGTKSAIQVIATYRPATRSNDFEALVTRELEYADSVVDGTLELPPKVLPGDRVSIVYRVINKGDVALQGLEARVHLPEGFVRDATGTGELIDGRVVRVALSSLEAGASSTVRIQGAFALGAHGDTPVHAEAGRIGADGAFAAAQKTDGTLSVLGGDLSVKLMINGSDKDRSVILGERQRVAISYENTSGETLDDVVLRIHFGGDPSRPGSTSSSVDMVDWEALEDSAGGTRDRDVLSYTSEEIGQLKQLAASGDGLIELSVPLSAHATSGRDVPIRAWVEATIGAVDGVKVNRTVTTQPITLRLQTDASLSAVARYASEEGAPVGSGPLPPVSGTSTTYRLEWEISKSLHALERITVTANLPKGVEFVATKEVEAGDVSYDADRRLVTWKLNALPVDIPTNRVSFDVKLTPSEADIGRFAPLLGETRFEFIDRALGESLLRTSPGLSTDLPEDALAKGKGVVKKP